MRPFGPALVENLKVINCFPLILERRFQGRPDDLYNNFDHDPLAITQYSRHNGDLSLPKVLNQIIKVDLHTNVDHSRLTFLILILKNRRVKTPPYTSVSEKNNLIIVAHTGVRNSIGYLVCWTSLFDNDLNSPLISLESHHTCYKNRT